MENTDRLQEYVFDEYTVVTNFEKFEDVEQYASEKGGEILEVGFTDGSDNPTPNNEAQLMANRKTFRVGLDDEYDVIYSDDERFQEKAQELLKTKKVLENDVAPEDWLADQNIATGDRIIVLKNGEINTVTTRERIKFLMAGNLYEMAVKIPNSTINE